MFATLIITLTPLSLVKAVKVIEYQAVNIKNITRFKSITYIMLFNAKMVLNNLL